MELKKLGWDWAGVGGVGGGVGVLLLLLGSSDEEDAAVSSLKGSLCVLLLLRLLLLGHSNWRWCVLLHLRLACVFVLATLHSLCAPTLPRPLRSVCMAVPSYQVHTGSSAVLLWDWLRRSAESSPLSIPLTLSQVL